MRDTRQRVRFLAAFSADRRPPFEREVGAQAHVGANGALRSHDLSRDRFHQTFDPRRRIGPREHFQRSLFQNLVKPRHVHARLIRREIGEHRELAVEDLFAASHVQAHDPADAGNADAVERELHVGSFFLTVRIEVQRTRAPVDPVGLERSCERSEPRRDFGKGHHIVRTLRERGMNVIVAGRQQVDIDCAGRQMPVSRPADRNFHAARQFLKTVPIELGLQFRRNVEKGRALGAFRGGAFKK